jgi:hypothetical protein
MPEQYYDWIDHKWRENPHVAGNRFRDVHESLIMTLLSEAVQKGCSDVQLYSGLLARALVSVDPDLMRTHGRHVARHTGEPIAYGEGSRWRGRD